MGDSVRRGTAILAHVVGLAGVGSTIWDLYEVRFWPSARTLTGLGLSLVLAVVGWRLGQIAHGHSRLALSVHGVAQLLWATPWIILHWINTGTIEDVSAYTYFRLLALPTALIGLMASVLLLEGFTQALASKRMSLRLTSDGDYGG